MNAPFFSFNARLFVMVFLCFSGGILGWDPVHTTCILCEMMMRWWEYYERSYKIWWKYRVLCFDKEFYLFSIRMVFLLKRNVFRDVVWNFLWEGVRCDASNRLLRNSSRDRPDDGIRVPVFISMVGRGVWPSHREYM